VVLTRAYGIAHHFWIPDVLPSMSICTLRRHVMLVGENAGNQVAVGAVISQRPPPSSVSTAPHYWCSPRCGRREGSPARRPSERRGKLSTEVRPERCRPTLAVGRDCRRRRVADQIVARRQAN
jgi:hypothetical protein